MGMRPVSDTTSEGVPSWARSGNRATMALVTARAVIDAWDAGDQEALAEAVATLRQVAPDPTPADYDPRPYIASQEWVFAKTMPTSPHFYVQIARSTDWVGHLQCLTWIRQRGQLKQVQGRQYRYVILDKWRYWALGVEHSIIEPHEEPRAGVESVQLVLGGPA